VNIVSADFFKLGFNEYASVMVPVDIAAIIATLVMLHLYFRKDIPATYEISRLKAPEEAIRDRNTFRTGWGVLALLLLGFFGLEPWGSPSAQLLLSAHSSCFWSPKKDMRLIPERCFAEPLADCDFLPGYVSGGLRTA
jgi:arsenical pump membrane protein